MISMLASKYSQYLTAITKIVFFILKTVAEISKILQQIQIRRFYVRGDILLRSWRLQNFCLKVQLKKIS